MRHSERNELKKEWYAVWLVIGQVCFSTVNWDQYMSYILNAFLNQLTAKERQKGVSSKGTATAHTTNKCEVLENTIISKGLQPFGCCLILVSLILIWPVWGT
jgi:hypothetical protein